MFEQMDPAFQLVANPGWSWRDGMRDLEGSRIVYGEWTDRPKGPRLAQVHIPDLGDAATAGVLLGMLQERGVLSDVVIQDGEWIVAVVLEGELRGYVAESIGAAAAWALLAMWESDAQERMAN